MVLHGKLGDIKQITVCRADIKVNFPLKYSSPLKGYSPVRGNVSEADKRVPVFGEKDVTK